MQVSSGKSGLPANAYTELKPGEVYTPIVGANDNVKELTFRAIFMGILMAILFSGAVQQGTRDIRDHGTREPAHLGGNRRIR